MMKSTLLSVAGVAAGLVLGLSLSTTPTATASTPDGETPAEETVCDDLDGAEFGLCNAYCEAMDCDLAYDEDPETEPHASDRACEQVLANFQKHSGGEDPPCLDEPMVEM